MASTSFSFSADQLATGGNQTQLIAYANRFGENLTELQQLLTEDLNGVFDGVHILPFYTPFDGADAGFDPVDHTCVDRRLGSWEQVRAISDTHTVMADMIVNHVSSEHAYYRDVLENGVDSPHAPMFLTFNAVFESGATEADLAAIYRPRPGLPFTHYTWGRGANAKTRLVWTTFTAQQIDIDISTEAGQTYLDEVLHALHAGGVTQVRLDAVGYAVKTPGTSCFMTAHTYRFIDALTAKARHLGMDVLVEIHSFYRNQIEVAKRVDRVYDFALPPLLLHGLHSGRIEPLLRWLQLRPLNAVTVLDTHDGIGIVDIGGDSQSGEAGLVTPEELSQLVDSIHAASADASRQATGWAANNVDVYQVNCTFPDACGSPEAYLLARAVQIFTPGIAQVYYAGLMAAPCDLDLLRRTGVGRDINRPYFTVEEVRVRLSEPTVAQQLQWLRLRRTHPAFHGDCRIGADFEAGQLRIDWTAGEHFARLEADFPRRHVTVTHS